MNQPILGLQKVVLVFEAKLKKVLINEKSLVNTVNEIKG
jgi:hypothetical protein